MLLAVVGVAVVLAMGLVTAAVGDTQAHAQNGPSGGGSVTVPPVTMGPAPTKPAVPSASPYHRPSWGCGSAFNTMC